MTIKPLILLPDPVLRQQSLPVERVDAELEGFIDDMLETMYDAPGIGLRPSRSVCRGVFW
jgi:peptide deformylase